MGVSRKQCEHYLRDAVDLIFRADSQIQAVGIGRHKSRFGFKATRNVSRTFPAGGSGGGLAVPNSVGGVPVQVESVSGDLVSSAQTLEDDRDPDVLEQWLRRPLACGLEIQNVDDDERRRKPGGGLLESEYTRGTLGGFVTLADGSPALLSAGHVLAGSNQGVRKQDQIMQPASLTPQTANRVARLADFVSLVASDTNAHPKFGNVNWNEVDAGVARLDAETPWEQAFLQGHELSFPLRIAKNPLGKSVYKVGRTTGKRWGVVDLMRTTVGPIPFACGFCWFNEVFLVNGEGFSERGDSGALVVTEQGEAVGLIFATNPKQTFVCPIKSVLKALNCTLAAAPASPPSPRLPVTESPPKRKSPTLKA